MNNRCCLFLLTVLFGVSHAFANDSEANKILETFGLGDTFEISSTVGKIDDQTDFSLGVVSITLKHKPTSPVGMFFYSYAKTESAERWRANINELETNYIYEDGSRAQLKTDEGLEISYGSPTGLDIWIILKEADSIMVLKPSLIENIEVALADKSFAKNATNFNYEAMFKPNKTVYGYVRYFDPPDESSRSVAEPSEADKAFFLKHNWERHICITETEEEARDGAFGKLKNEPCKVIRPIKQENVNLVLYADEWMGLSKFLEFDGHELSNTRRRQAVNFIQEIVGDYGYRRVGSGQRLCCFHD